MRYIVMAFFVFILTLLCLFMGIKNASAGAVITNFHRDGNKVTATVAAWSEPGKVPNPCYGWISCYVGPDVTYTKWGTGSLAGSCYAGGCIEASSLLTTADIARKYRQEHPLPFTYTFQIDHTEDSAACAGMVYVSAPKNEPWLHGQILPGTICAVIPPNNYQCSLNIPPYINHGTLSSDEINGNSASVTGEVRCNYGGLLIISTLSDSGDNIVHLKENTLISTVTVNGKNATGGLVLEAKKDQPVNVNISSTLSLYGHIDSGSYSGSLIVYVNYS